jgi:hypothetical protein
MAEEATSADNPLSTSSTEDGCSSMPEREPPAELELPAALTLAGLGARLAPAGELSAAARGLRALFWLLAAAGPAVAATVVANSPHSGSGGAILVTFFAPCLLFLAFPFAFGNLCEVTRRPGGQLEALLVDGADGATATATTTTRVDQRVVKNLAAWRKWLRAIVIFFAVFLLLMAAFFSKFAATPLEAVGIAVQLLSAALGLCATGAWVFSLRVAAAAAMAKTTRLARRIDGLGAELTAGGTFDAKRWADEVEAPARALALDTLPLLSGWGTAVAFVGAGYAGLAASIIVVLIDAKVTGAALPLPVVILIYGFTLGIGFIPVVIADAPAKVSTVSAQMIETLNTIRLRNLPLYHELTPIYDTLLSVNHGQGMGFKIGGVVINRRKLWTGVTSIWSIALTVLPMLSGDDGCPTPDLAASMHECDYVRDCNPRFRPLQVSLYTRSHWDFQRPSLFSLSMCRVGRTRMVSA